MTPKEFTEAMHNNPDAAINAVDEGRVDPNGVHEGVPVLMQALMRDLTGIAHLLLQQKADPNVYATNPSLMAGMAPIHATSNPAMIDALVKHHALIDLPARKNASALIEEGDTAMHIAAIVGDRELALALLNHGPDLSFPFVQKLPEKNHTGLALATFFDIRVNQTPRQRLADVLLSDMPRRLNNQAAMYTEIAKEKVAPLPMNAAGLAQMREAIAAHTAKNQEVDVIHFEPAKNEPPSVTNAISYAVGKLAGSFISSMKSAVTAIQTRIAYDGLQPQTGGEKAQTVLQAINGATAILMEKAKVHMQEYRQEIEQLSRTVETPGQK